MDLALNNLLSLICHKTQQTKPNVKFIDKTMASIIDNTILRIIITILLLHFYKFLSLALPLSLFLSLSLSLYVYIYIYIYIYR